MIVAQLIAELQQLDPKMEVLIDATPAGSKFFFFREINTVGEGKDAEGWKFVALACGQDSEPFDNDN